MADPDGKRTSLASYTWGGWGSQNDVTRFRDVFQPDGGSFSPSYPLVPPEREQVRLWDYPVGYNAIYTPRSYEAIGFDELRALAESHDITRLAIETRKDQIEKLDWTIKSRNEQIIHGRPWRLLTSDELMYLPRNPRPHKAYGFSPVEQIVTTVNIALRRQAMQLQHFTEGNVPPGLLNAPDGWSPEQIRQFQEWFD